MEEGESGRVGEGIIESGVKKLEFEMNRKPIQSHRDLEVYQLALDVAMQIFELSKKFPVEERYSLTDQIRRSSRSVCLNLREAWAKRRYEAHFISKHSDCDGENSETDSSLDFARDCGYLTDKRHGELTKQCAEVGRMLGAMMKNCGLIDIVVSPGIPYYHAVGKKA